MFKFKTLRKFDFGGDGIQAQVNTTWIRELWYSRTLVENIVERIPCTLLWQPRVLLRIDRTGDCEEGAQKFWGGEVSLGQHGSTPLHHKTIESRTSTTDLRTCTELFSAWVTNLMVQATWQSDMEFSSLEVVVLSAVWDTVVGWRDWVLLVCTMPRLDCLELVAGEGYGCCIG